MCDLVDAVSIGDLEAVRSLLLMSGEADADADGEEDDEIEPIEISAATLRVALESGYKKIAELLVNFETFDQNLDKGEPLRLCIQLGYLDLASVVMEEGANPNFRCDDSNSALMLALESEYYDLAQQMIGAGAEVNIRNGKGWTPLIWASIKGYKKAVEFLLANGADVHICNDDGWNALTGAYFKQRTDIVELLTAKSAHFGRKYNEAALLSAYEYGYNDLVKKLINDEVWLKVVSEQG